MIVRTNKSTYFLQDTDSNLVPIGSTVFKNGKMIFVNDFDDLAEPEPEPEEQIPTPPKEPEPEEIPPKEPEPEGQITPPKEEEIIPPKEEETPELVTPEEGVSQIKVEEKSKDKK